MRSASLETLDSEVQGSAREQRWEELAGSLAGGAVLVVGSVVLIGWLADIPRLGTPGVGLGSTKANTALCFVLAGTSLLLQVRRRARPVAIALAALVCVIALLTLGEYAFGVSRGIDQLLARDAGDVGARAPGRMGANTAACFLLVGLALCGLSAVHTRLVATIGTLTAFVVALAALLGYVFGVPRAERAFITENVTPMSLTTCLTFLVLVAGMLLARPRAGVMALITSRGAGGVLVRRLLLPALVVPIALGSLRLAGQRLGLYGTEEGLALFATALIVVFGVLIMVTANSLEGTDERRRESEARRRAILDSALDCVVAVDDDGRILELNPAAEDAFGRSRRDALGKAFAETMLAPDQRDPYRRAVAAVLAGGSGPAAGERLELTAQRADGDEFPVEVSIACTRIAGRTLLSVYLRDISQRKSAERTRTRLEAQLHQAQKMEAVGRLAGGLAHDFNNLLTVILGQSELLLLGKPSAAVSEGAGAIIGAAERGAALTRQLLAFSRHRALEPQILDLNAIVAEVAPLLRRTLGEDVSLTVRAAPRLAPVEADPSQIHQVLLNLAVNARDAMPDGGELAIATANVRLGADDVQGEMGDHVELSVSDSGHGMDEDTRARIFDPFFTTKAVGKGTGLGLASVYAIARQSGGSVSVDSEPGQGTTFRVLLPAADAPADLGTRPAPRPTPHATRGAVTVLLVEDDDAVRRMVHRMLEAEGYDVLQASGADEAAALCEHHGERVAIVLTDIVMPGVSGLELAARLRTLRPGLPVLCMSGYSEEALEDRGGVGTATGFIEKPFNAAALAGKLRSLLDAP